MGQTIQFGDYPVTLRLRDLYSNHRRHRRRRLFTFFLVCRLHRENFGPKDISHFKKPKLSQFCRRISFNRKRWFGRLDKEYDDFVRSLGAEYSANSRVELWNYFHRVRLRIWPRSEQCFTHSGCNRRQSDYFKCAQVSCHKIKRCIKHNLGAQWLEKSDCTEARSSASTFVKIEFFYQDSGDA